MAISKFLDPKNDVAFRRIFGSLNNKDILIHFLNDILDLTGVDQIKDVSFLSPIQDPEIISQKQSIVDILCTDSNGVQMILEMQVAKTTGFEKRAQYYASKAYSTQANKGDQYHNLKGVIFIAIADFILFPDKLAYKSDHVTLDKITYQHDLKDFSFTFIELPKFKKTKEDQLENIVEKWIYFFKYADETSEEELKRIIGSDVIIGRAYDVVDEFNWTPEERLAYDQATKRTVDYLSSLAEKLNEGIQIGKERGIKIGEEKGKEEGIQIGEERGIKIGEEKGKEEGIQIGTQKGREEEKIEFARKLLKANMSIDFISETTGLSADKIKQLQEEITL